jgi:hypothetical protein
LSTNTILATTPLVSTNYLLRATGTTIGNSLIFDNGTNVGIGNTNTTYKLDVSGTGNFTGALTGTSATFSGRLTSGGTIQITGAGSPTTGAGLEMGYGNFTAGRTTITSYNRTGAAYVGNDYNALDYIWYTSGGQKMTLTNAGNVGIGTSSPSQILNVYTTSKAVGDRDGINLQTSNSAAADIGLPIIWSSNGTILNYATASIVGRRESATSTNYSGYLQFATTDSGGSLNERMRITSGGDININMPNSTDRSLSWYSANGVYQVAAIKAITDPSYNDAGILKFFTAGTSSSGMAERMRITSGGIIQVGSTNRNALQQSIFGYNGNYKTLILGSTGTNYLTDSVTLCFGVDVSGNAGGSFSGDGSECIFRNAGSFKSPNSANTNYNTLISWNSSGVVTVTTSDYRAKEDLKSFEALPMVKAMKLYDFRWIELQERMHGAIAHELQEIVPYAVIGEKDGETRQGVDYSKLVPILAKAIQELSKQNEELSNRLIKLESK